MNNYGVVRISTTFYQTTIMGLDTSKNMIACNSAFFEYALGKENIVRLSYDASKEVAIKLKESGIDNVDIIVRGPGLGREAAIRALEDNGVNINLIKDKTPIPHNGCVPIKRKVKKYIKSNFN